MIRLSSRSLTLCTALLGLNGLLSGISGCKVGNATATPAQTATSVPAVTLAIAGATQVRSGSTLQFTAALSDGSNPVIVWEVNGIKGGTSSSGTITSKGLYTSPITQPLPANVTIEAVAQNTATTSGSLVESILNPVPAAWAITASQSSADSDIVVDAAGSSLVPGAQIQIGGVPVATTMITPSELEAAITPSKGTTTLSVSILNPDPGAAASETQSVPVELQLSTFPAASRFLDQTSFGPTLDEIQHVQQVGISAYLTEQFNTPPTFLSTIPIPTPTFCQPGDVYECFDTEWWQAVLTAPDQLRQRVAFALSEMFVVSSQVIPYQAIIPFQNLLVKDAFGNFADLLRDVTLSPAMGAYLDMLNSAGPGAGQIANENFAREAMQLFTIGTYQLNADGTPQLDSSGNPIPTYTAAQVQAFARAYTGWTYAAANGSSSATFPEQTPNWGALMMPVESYHDKTQKPLLNGTVLSAGQSAEDDLSGALTNLFEHQNVGPFICRHLIQHLVSGNPSPAYVSRVSAVFADNGNGVRGDLRAVISAILLDSEARAGDLDPTLDAGHLREPVLYLADVMRGLGYVNNSAIGDYSSLSRLYSNLSQVPYAAGNVFSYFSPDYTIPGSTEVSPEFGIENTATVILRLSLGFRLAADSIDGFTTDLSATSPLGQAAADPGILVDTLSRIFMHGQMPSEMRSAIVAHLATLNSPADRVRVATYLVITSSHYKIQH